MTVLRLGTRASLLATTQSQHVADAVAAASGREVELVPITSDGDVLTGPLAQMGGTGVFATALRDALLRNECDFLVHSMKDLPTAPFEGIVVGAVPVRASQRDILHSRDGLTLDELPSGARVGTGSPRRVAQVLARRPDLVVEGIRGNVDSRLRKVADGQYDAIVLAEAGLRRIGRDAAITQVLDWPTSAAQGALAVEVRDGDAEVAAAVRLIEDADTALAANLERAVLRRLEAGCAAPVAIDAERHGDVVTLVAQVYAEDGGRSVGASRQLDVHVDVDAAAADVVAELLEGGAADLADLAGSSR
ncbi:Porphobilinogen deaminase [Microbacterium oleivorans]|uniref:Hydroxymethylbilane synthase n=1 Tax=Microbacterium oleivorans TaxID=273677 RepID=A0A031FTG4_9MICO|nr:hydroxymethylbilane synthase [Microbacterium oleivorans]AZS44236.1 Porphobilinogen deaminase [Microbacterium oleivorans]EZP26920.1 Porphobilinogen deaminase [Microbacterium oleivorans]